MARKTSARKTSSTTHAGRARSHCERGAEEYRAADIPDAAEVCDVVSSWQVLRPQDRAALRAAARVANGHRGGTREAFVAGQLLMRAKHWRDNAESFAEHALAYLRRDWKSAFGTTLPRDAKKKIATAFQRALDSSGRSEASPNSRGAFVDAKFKIAEGHKRMLSIARLAEKQVRGVLEALGVNSNSAGKFVEQAIKRLEDENAALERRLTRT